MALADPRVKCRGLQRGLGSCVLEDRRRLDEGIWGSHVEALDGNQDPRDSRDEGRR